MLGGGGLNFHLHLDVKLHLECGKNMGAGGDLQEKGPTLHLTESPPPNRPRTVRVRASDRLKGGS